MSIVEEENDKLEKNEFFIPIQLLSQIIKKTSIKKINVEEKNSELWFETISGKGKVIFNSGLSYVGRVKNGLFESGKNNEPCEINFPDGTKYKGEIHGNQITGKGEYFFPTGSNYQGEVLNGLRHGYGKYVSNNEKIVYEGYWENGLKSGKGVLTKNGATCEGIWKNGNLNGIGKMTWPSGNVYQGEFTNNQITGNGFMLWKHLNEKYIGHWINGYQDGKGIQTWNEKKAEGKFIQTRYVGEFYKGKRKGFGIAYYSNGSYYIGTWNNNKKDGFGCFTYKDGTRFVGMFTADQMINKDSPVTIETIENYFINEQNKLKSLLNAKNSPRKSILKSILAKTNQKKII